MRRAIDPKEETMVKFDQMLFLQALVLEHGFPKDVLGSIS